MLCYMYKVSVILIFGVPYFFNLLTGLKQILNETNKNQYIPLFVIITSIFAFMIVLIRLTKIVWELNVGRLSVPWTIYPKTIDEQFNIKTRITVAFNDGNCAYNILAGNPISIEIIQKRAYLCSYFIQLPTYDNRLGIGSIIFEPLKNVSKR